MHTAGFFIKGCPVFIALSTVFPGGKIVFIEEKNRAEG